MIRLKNQYEGKSALVIMGGPSIIENKFDLKRINKDRYTIFIESKALTPGFLSFGIKPDFLLMSFPEKCKDNTVQHFIFRSMLAQFNIDSLLKREFKSELAHMRNNFEEYFEPWKIHKGSHKRYRWKPNVYLKDSPYDLIRNLPETRIITRRDLLQQYFPDFEYANQLYLYEPCEEPETFNMESYYSPVEQDGKVILRYNSFLNSAAIALYPLLYFMGFRDVFFLGMDMSVLGSMEYSAPYVFKSMLHFRWFFFRSRRAFNADYKVNRPYYFRPQSEFEDLREILDYGKMRFIRVHNDFKYAAPIEYISTISFDQFLLIQ